MTIFEIDHSEYATIYSATNEDGLTVNDLLEYLNKIKKKNPELLNKPVCLCLVGVPAEETVICKVTNEGDNNILWLELHESVEPYARSGFSEHPNNPNQN